MTTSRLKSLLLPLAIALLPWTAFSDDSVDQTVPLTELETCDLSFTGDTLRILTNGHRESYEVSKNEFFLRDKLTRDVNIETLADEMDSVEAMRKFVRDEDGVWGQECKLVLYREGMPKTVENRRFLTHKIEVKLAPEVASMETLRQIAGQLGVEVLSKEITERGWGFLEASCAGSGFKAAELLSTHADVLVARPMLTIPLVKCAPLPTDPFFNPIEYFYVTRTTPVDPIW